MSDSGVIRFGREPNAPCIYLHWHGSPGHVHGFLLAAQRLGVRGYDPTYAAARVAQIAMNCVPGPLGVGIMSAAETPATDHGVYIVEDLRVVEHDNSGSDPVDPDALLLCDGVYHEAMKRNRSRFATHAAGGQSA